jgi:hypothetical protein
MPPILSCWLYGKLIEDMFSAFTSRTLYHFSIFSTLQSPFSKGNYMVVEGKYCSVASNKADLHACKELNFIRNGCPLCLLLDPNMVKKVNITFFKIIFSKKIE